MAFTASLILKKGWNAHTRTGPSPPWAGGGKRATTIPMAPHYMAEAAGLCDRLVSMDQGTLLASGTPDDLVAKHAGAETAIVRPDPDRRKEVEQALAALDVEYRDRGRAIAVFNKSGGKLDLDGLANATVRLRASTLEDVFLNLTGRELKDE